MQRTARLRSPGHQTLHSLPSRIFIERVQFQTSIKRYRCELKSTKLQETGPLAGVGRGVSTVEVDRQIEAKKCLFESRELDEGLPLIPLRTEIKRIQLNRSVEKSNRLFVSVQSRERDSTGPTVKGTIETVTKLKSFLETYNGFFSLS
jgi:hypothetical protein